MRVLLTGAAGFIGRALVAALVGAGHDVVALSRNASRVRAALPGLADAWTWDPLSGEVPLDALRVDAVIHLAGELVVGRWTARKKRKIHESRQLGTRTLVSGIAALSPAARPPTLLSTSAVGYYGERGEEVITEDSEPGPDFLAVVCRDWEAEARAAEPLGVRVVRMRMPIILGPGGGALPPMVAMARFGINGRLGSGQQWWCWVSLRDVVRFALDALTDERFDGAYNLCSPNPVRQIEFARALGRALSRPAALPTPAWALKLALGEFNVEILTSKRQLPARLSAMGWTFLDSEVEAAIRAALAPEPGGS